jgi:AcrR family transcriptional regulator
MSAKLPQNARTDSPEAGDLASLPGVRERLFEAGIETMARRGYHGTTTRDITTRANVSPAALYIHFPSKQHLLFAISRFGHAQAIEVVRRARQKPGSPADRLLAVVTELAALHAEQYKIARVAQYDLAALREEHLAEIHKLRRALRSDVRATIQEGVDAGCFRCDDVPGTTLAIISMCVDIARWFDPAGSRTAKDLSAALACIALRIVSADLTRTTEAIGEGCPP